MAHAAHALEGLQLLTHVEFVIGIAMQTAMDDLDGLEDAARRARFPHLAEAALAKAVQKLITRNRFRCALHTEHAAYSLDRFGSSLVRSGASEGAR